MQYGVQFEEPEDLVRGTPISKLGGEDRIENLIWYGKELRFYAR